MRAVKTTTDQYPPEKEEDDDDEDDDEGDTLDQVNIYNVLCNDKLSLKLNIPIKHLLFCFCKQLQIV